MENPLLSLKFDQKAKIYFSQIKLIYSIYRIDIVNIPILPIGILTFSSKSSRSFPKVPMNALPYSFSKKW